MCTWPNCLICIWISNTCGTDAELELKEPATLSTILSRGTLNPFGSLPSQSTRMRNWETWHGQDVGDGRFELAQNECEAPIVFGPKGDRKLQFCMEYCKVSTVAIRDSYPTRGTDEWIDSLDNAAISWKVDAKSGYWQVSPNCEDRDETALASGNGLLRSTQMQLGLKTRSGRFNIRWESNNSWWNASLHWSTSMISSYSRSLQTNISTMYGKYWR